MLGKIKEMFRFVSKMSKIEKYVNGRTNMEIRTGEKESGGDGSAGITATPGTIDLEERLGEGQRESEGVQGNNAIFQRRKKRRLWRF